MVANENAAITRDDLRQAVNEATSQMVSEIRTFQRWSIVVTVALILIGIGIGTPLALGKFSTDLRADIAESARYWERDIARGACDIRWTEKDLHLKSLH